MHGHADYSGPFAFSLRVGSFIGPPLGGLAFDLGGIWGGMAVLTLWALGILLSASLLPPGRALPTGQRRVAAADLLPRVSDYMAAFKLTAQPAMATVLMITVFRIAASSVQDSFYPIYLKSIGFNATQIGILITVSSGFAAAGALSIGRLTRYASGLWLLIATTMGSILFIAVTPLFSSYWLLMMLAALRGICMGVSQPLMLSLLVGAAERNAQGLGVSLRTTANRAAAAVTPITMGAVAHFVGLSASFLVIGGVLMAGIVVVARRVLAVPAAEGKERV
jgi:predicted MFS family arabinose efflux permease